jgi:hypothetical protein
MPDKISPSRVYGQPVRIHYNLQRCKPGDPPSQDEACWVVNTKQGGGWKVLGYVPSLLIGDAEFVVSAPGLVRIRTHQRRKVIAWIDGVVLDPNKPSVKKETGTFDDWEGFSFNPFKKDFFYLEDGKFSPVWDAPLVYVSGRRGVLKLHVRNPRTSPVVAGSDQLELLAEHLGGNVGY